MLVPIEEFPSRGHPAEEVRAFQDKHFRAALRQYIRGHQTVVTCPDDDRVIVRHADSSDRDPSTERTMSYLTYLRQW